MTPNQAIVSLHYGPHRGKRLKFCPKPFIDWLLSSCKTPPNIKSCNFLIDSGVFTGRRINSLSLVELQQFAADDTQGIWQNQIAKEKLARLEEKEAAEERCARKPFRPVATEDKRSLPAIQRKSVVVGGERIKLFALSIVELNQLQNQVCSTHERYGIGVAIRYKQRYGEDFQPG